VTTHFHVPSAEVKNAWSCTSFAYVFVASCLIKRRNKVCFTVLESAVLCARLSVCLIPEEERKKPQPYETNPNSRLFGDPLECHSVRGSTFQEMCLLCLTSAGSISSFSLTMPCEVCRYVIVSIPFGLIIGLFLSAFLGRQTAGLTVK
jgi:hypothetical protein